MDSCSESADCIDTEGSYDCMCNAGYSGDGFSCESEPHLDSGYFLSFCQRSAK